MKKLKLRGYQSRAVADCLSYLEGGSSAPVLAVLPTAAGKSLIIGEVAKNANRRCVILQPSIELLKQNTNKAIALGCEGVAVYSAGVGMKEFGDTLTYATLGSIKKDVDTLVAMGVDTLLIDEAHYKFDEKKGSEFRKFVDKLKPKKIIGFTATPYKLVNNRSGSRLLFLNRLHPKYFKDIIHVTQIQELVENGYWSKIKYKAYQFDSSGLMLNSTGSDFTDDSVKEVLEEQGVNNNIYLEVMDMLDEGMDSILVFVDSVETANKLVEFTPNSACVSSKTPNKERAELTDKFLKGEIKVMYNYGIFSTGFDYPELRCVILGRPTNSMSLYAQKAGRGVRIHENKDYFLLIDFCGNVERFGKIEDQEIKNLPGFGWGVFAGGYLRTSTYLTLPPMSEEELLNRKPNAGDYTLTFGKFSGKRVSELARTNSWYLNYILSEWDFNTPDRIIMRDSIIGHLRSSCL